MVRFALLFKSGELNWFIWVDPEKFGNYENFEDQRFILLQFKFLGIIQLNLFRYRKYFSIEGLFCFISMTLLKPWICCKEESQRGWDGCTSSNQPERGQMKWLSSILQVMFSSKKDASVLSFSLWQSLLFYILPLTMHQENLLGLWSRT